MRSISDLVGPLDDLRTMIQRFEAVRNGDPAIEHQAAMGIVRAADALAVFADDGEWRSWAFKRPAEHEAIADQIRRAAYGVLPILQSTHKVYRDGRFEDVRWEDVRAERFVAVSTAAEELGKAVGAEAREDVEIQPNIERMLFDALRFNRPKPKMLGAHLVQFMVGRKTAPIEDVAEEVHKHEETSRETIRMNCIRVNEHARHLALGIEYRVAGGTVIKEIRE
jgi:hypothetical protein